MHLNNGSSVDPFKQGAIKTTQLFKGPTAFCKLCLEEKDFIGKQGEDVNLRVTIPVGVNELQPLVREQVLTEGGPLKVLDELPLVSQPLCFRPFQPRPGLELLRHFAEGCCQ